MICKFACRENNVSLTEEVDVAKGQHPGRCVMVVENIPHIGKGGARIDNRAILFAPVGNQSVFWDDSFREIVVPKIAIVGFSTSLKAADDFYNNYRESNNFKKACVDSSFGGSKKLRKNIVRYANFLNFGKIIGPSFNADNMFDSQQKDIYYTQIIKCCSVGKTNGEYQNTSAIYPNKIDLNARQQYLRSSAHRRCIENYFIKELGFSRKIPLLLIFKPAWENLKAMDLMDLLETSAEIVEWIPHPSDPGRAVNNLLRDLKVGKGLQRDRDTKSCHQMNKLRDMINNTDF